MLYRDRIFPMFHDAGVAAFHWHRDQVVPRAEGRVLEVGAGTGLNLDRYRPAAVGSVLAIEPSAGMIRRARPRAAAAPVPVTLLRGDGQCLPFSDGTFDACVATLVFCTIPDPDSSLREIRRVLRPSGALHFVEHVRSSVPHVRRWQDRLTPLWRRLGGGCCLNRDTVASIERARFRLEDVVVEALRGFTPAIVRTVAYGTAAVA